jgi:hypothetical protein
VVVRISTWCFFIVTQIDHKRPKMSDMWKPLVLPHHHVDVIMKNVSLYMCHILCTDADIICIDAHVSSTDVDASLLTGLG